MIERSIHKRKSQSLVETGIFGVLILSAFTFLLAYIQKLDSEQRALMENFRVTLKKSHDENAITSYGTLNDKLVPDGSVPSKGRVLASASGYVHWAVPQITEGDKSEVVGNSDQGQVTKKTDNDNDPARKYYYYAYGDSKREHELGSDSDVSGVNRDYKITNEKTISQSYGNDETPDINGTIDEKMNYDLIGATTINQTRSVNSTLKKRGGS